MTIGNAQLHHIWKMWIKFEWNLFHGIRNKLGTNCVYGQVQPNPKNEKKMDLIL
jgi:hypothetical protein